MSENVLLFAVLDSLTQWCRFLRPDNVLLVPVSVSRIYVNHQSIHCRSGYIYSVYRLIQSNRLSRTCVAMCKHCYTRIGWSGVPYRSVIDKRSLRTSDAPISFSRFRYDIDTIKEKSLCWYRYRYSICKYPSVLLIYMHFFAAIIVNHSTALSTFYSIALFWSI